MLGARASAESFPGGGGQRKKDRKLAKIPTNSTILTSSGGEAAEKRPKNSEKRPKI